MLHRLITGLLAGASLNGIGKRCSLVDNMSGEDTKTIVGELRSLGLVLGMCAALPVNIVYA
jgi:hypothetical protein